jgi:heme-degrading monooxygenase HmoA
MSDFRDFLKRKYANVAIGEFKPGMFAKVQQLYEAAVKTYEEGFMRAYLLREPGTERGISIILWEGEDETEAQESEEYKAILQQMGPLFAQPPTLRTYELVAEFSPEDTSQSRG